MVGSRGYMVGKNHYSKRVVSMEGIRSIHVSIGSLWLVLEGIWLIQVSIGSLWSVLEDI